MMKPKKNPVTKIIGAGVKAAAKAAGAKPSLKAAQKAKPLANPKSGVRVKPAAKTKPAPINTAKMSEKTYKSMGRYENKQYDARFPEPQYDVGKTRDMRIYNSKNPSASSKASRPVQSPANPDFRPRVKINTDPTKPKGIFGPLKKKAAAANTPANRAKAANNARALKAANKKK
jgi:hypothetical protein